MKAIEMNIRDERQPPVTGATYEPPLIEVLEVEIEKGFRNSIEGFEEGEEQNW